MTSTSNGNVPAMGNLERTMVDATLIGDSKPEEMHFRINTEGKYCGRIIIFKVKGWSPFALEPAWADTGARVVMPSLGMLFKPNTGATEAKMEIEEWS